MNDILNQIRTANASGLYYVALFSALAVPDICGALEAPDGLSTGARYAAWFDQYVAPTYHGTLDGQTCYQFRCSMLHQGSTQHPKSQYHRIIFLEPTGGMILHNNVMNDVLNIDVRVFCEDIVAAAESWLPAAQKSPYYQTNLMKFVTRHPNGLAPYIVGVPVIG